MKIGFISDTHGSAQSWEQASRFFQGAEMILHAGDVLYHGPRNPLPEGHGPMKLVELMNASPWPVVLAKGNCDAEIDLDLLKWPVNEPNALVTLSGLKIILSNSHAGEEQLLRWAESFDADLVVSGHTHQAKLEKKDGIILLNPGSAALPKGGPASAAVLEEGMLKVIALADGKTLAELALD